MVSSDELKNKLKKLVLRWVYSKEEMFEKLNNINNSLDSKQSKYTGDGNKNVVTNNSGMIITEDKPIIPTKTSELTNDSNFLTNHQDITGKVNISDIQDNLTSTDTDKPLSAKQGKVLKDLIGDAITYINQ